MISHWESKLDSLSLDNDTTCTEFVNLFEMYVRKLTKLGETWGDDRMVREFKSRVHHEDYDTEVRTHEGQFKDLIKIVRKREQDLNRLASHSSKVNKRTRRFKAPSGDDDEEGGRKSDSGEKGRKKSEPEKTTPYIPFIPKFLYNSLDQNTKKNLATWRKIVNQGNTMGKDDLVTNDKGGNESDTNSEPPKKKQRPGGKEKEPIHY